METVVLLAGTAVLCQHGAFPAAGVTDGPGTLHFFVQQDGQPVPQFCIVGGRIDRHSYLAEEGRVKDALMGLAVCRNEPGTVDGKHHVLPQQVHIVDDLIIGALQEGGIDADHRQHPLTGKACREGDCVLFRHAHIKEPFRVGVREELQACTVLHGSSDGTDLLILGPLLIQETAEHCGEGLFGCHLRVRDAVDQIKGRDAMEVPGVVFGRGIALALFGDHMEKMGAGLLMDAAQHFLQLLLVVSIEWAIVMKAHILEHGGMIHGPADHGLSTLDRGFQRRPDDRHTIQEGPHILLGVVIAACGAQMAQIPGKRAHVFGDGHFVVIQDDQQVIQSADIVHALVDHAAGKGTVSDQGHDLSRLSPQLFGPGNAHRQRKRRIAVSGNKGIVFALIGVGETGNAVQLPQLGKALPAAGQQFVGIALMSHVKNDLIRGGGQHPVQGNRQFHCTQVRGQMAAGLGDIFQKKLPDLRAKLHGLLSGQLFRSPG